MIQDQSSLASDAAYLDVYDLRKYHKDILFRPRIETIWHNKKY